MKIQNAIVEAMKNAGISPEERRKRNKPQFNSFLTGKKLETKRKNRKIKKYRKRQRYLSSVPRSYKIYIQSPYWEKRKNQFYQKFGRKCFICKSPYHVQLHHMIYG